MHFNGRIGAACLDSVCSTAEHPRLGPAHSGHHLLEAAHLFHHLLHLTEAVQQRVQFGDAHAAAFGDAVAASGVENMRTTPFLWCHVGMHSVNSSEFTCALVLVFVL